MCRVLCYLGQQDVLLHDMLFAPDNSLIHQSFDPKLMLAIQNLAGFGMAAWSKNSEIKNRPFLYKVATPPFFDENLYQLSQQISSRCLLAHVRGVSYDSREIVVRENAHPFMYQDYTLALAHNGSIADLYLLKSKLLKYIKPDVIKNMSGSTDSEWVYCLLMSQFKDPTGDISLNEAWNALINTFHIIRKTRQELGIEKASPANLFITNGKYVIITRFVFDFGRNEQEVEKAFLEYHSLWYTYGEKYGLCDGTYKMYGSNSRPNIVFASEPLTEDLTTWVELPEYSITKAWIEDGEIIIRTFDFDAF